MHFKDLLYFNLLSHMQAGIKNIGFVSLPMLNETSPHKSSSVCNESDGFTQLMAFFGIKEIIEPF